MTSILNKCQYCDYSSIVKCNVKRHQNSKHKDKIAEDMCKNSNGENVVIIDGNVVANEENVVQSSFLCEKCNRMYKTMRYLLKH